MKGKKKNSPFQDRMARPTPSPAAMTTATPAGAWWRRAALSSAAESGGYLRVGLLHAPRRFAGLQVSSTCSRKCRIPRVKSGEADGSPRTEDVNLDEETLRRDLELAVQEEDYALAATLRDELRVLQEDSKASVLATNGQFYNAFRNGDLAAMQSIWAKGDHVYVVHPSAGRISGYDVVMQSWEMVCDADHEFPLQIDLKNIEVHVRGDVGYVTCMEVVKTKGSSWGKQVATNVFEKVGGKWFMCIHHASHFDE